MTSRKHHILMADIIGSSRASPQRLMTAFRKLVDRANQQFREELLSPLTITLGDEFQGVTRSLRSSLRIVVWLEEEKLAVKPAFRMRYVLQAGAIATPINPQRAHGMLGAGLTAARKRLEGLKREKRRFALDTGDAEKDEPLNLALALYEELYDSWDERDAGLIWLLLRLRDYRKVATRWRRHPSSVFRRQRTLRIEAYHRIKALLECLAKP